MSVPRIQMHHQRCSTESRIQRNTHGSIFQNFLNTWCDHEIADSAQPRYRSIVTRPFSLLVRAGSGHETRNSSAFVIYVAIAGMSESTRYKSTYVHTVKLDVRAFVTLEIAFNKTIHSQGVGERSEPHSLYSILLL